MSVSTNIKDVAVKMQRLDAAVNAVCPIISVAVGIIGDSTTVTFRPTPEATDQQIAAAQAVINAFDWSDAADRAFQDNQEPQLSNFRDAVANAIADIDAYLAIANTATAAQVRAEVASIDQRQKKILQTLVRIAVKLLNK